jgi:hypothetical protein
LVPSAPGGLFVAPWGQRDIILNPKVFPAMFRTKAPTTKKRAKKNESLPALAIFTSNLGLKSGVTPTYGFLDGLHFVKTYRGLNAWLFSA